MQTHKISCCIVDDEPPAIQLLEKYCSLVDELSVSYTCQSAVEAFGLLKKSSVELLFLDIQMPILNGIDFLKSMKNPPSVIITTAYREYAVEGYDLDIVDYLLKPISFDRFLKAIDRYRNTLTTSVPNIKEEINKTIFFNINKKNHKVELENILYLESLKDYVRIHTTNEKLIVKGNIGTIMKQLPESHFIRIHRSYAIALQSLKSYNQKIVEIDSATIPIGESYKEAFLNKMKQY